MSHPTSSWTLVADPSRAPTTLGSARFAPGVDFKLDGDGDLDLSTGDIQFTAVGLEATAQGIWLRIQFIRGELFVDRDFGIPYLPNDIVPETDAILGGKFSELKARAAFRQAILAAPGVETLEHLAITFDRATRVMTVDFKVIATAGTIEASQEL